MTEIEIHGTCADEFAEISDAFEANFREAGEVGARVAVLRGDEVVVDLWGGHTTETREQPWDASSLVVCMSVSKGVTALAAHVLASRGLLDYDAPVALYWPEFAQGGKEDILVRDALSHRASLCIIDDSDPGDALDWELFTGKIARQTPNWEPRTDEAYHTVTYGFIVGEIVRRIDGRPIQQFIREELATPLDADFVLGCDDHDASRVVTHIANPRNQLMTGGLVNERTIPMFRPMPADPNYRLTADYLRMVNPSGNGVSNALGLTRLFAPLANGGRANGHQILDTVTIAAASTEQWHHADHLFGNDFRVALGLLLNIPFNYWGREGNVGSAGAGGFTVFADPKNNLTFAYTPNRYTTGFGLGDESRRLVDALYRCVDADAPG